MTSTLGSRKGARTVGAAGARRMLAPKLAGSFWAHSVVAGLSQGRLAPKARDEGRECERTTGCVR